MYGLTKAPRLPKQILGLGFDSSLHGLLKGVDQWCGGRSVEAWSRASTRRSTFPFSLCPSNWSLTSPPQQSHDPRTPPPSPWENSDYPCFLYADDAAIFVASIKEDIQFLATSLASFGEVTDLVTNCSTRLVAPMRCDSVNLDDILQAFPAKRTSFPMRYLGLPLSVKCLKRIHFQHLEDKIAGKLPPWQGRHVAPVGRLSSSKGSSPPLPFIILHPMTFR